MQITRHYKYFISLLLFVLMAGVLPERAMAGRAVGDFTLNCSSCHGTAQNPINDLNRNVSVASIRSAINDEGSMRFLGFLTNAQIDDIAVQLGSASSCSSSQVWNAVGSACQAIKVCATPKVLSADKTICIDPNLTCNFGEYFDSEASSCSATRIKGLYVNNCQTCHGSLTNSTKKGRTAAQIVTAINTPSNNMGGLSLILSPAQIDDIAVSLGSATTCVSPKKWDPTSRACVSPNSLQCTSSQLPNADLTSCVTIASNDYAASCASCHGPLATSLKKGKTAAQIQAAIDANIGGMGGLSILTTSQVADIAKQLVVTCSGIQVANSTGTACINPTLSCVTPKVPNAAGTDCIARAVGDYELSCADCHKPLTTTTKSGRTATQIQTAINSTYTGMKISSLTSLTPAQIDDIAIQLGAATTCSTPKAWDANGSICGAAPVICTLPDIRNTLTNKCVVAITKVGVVGVAGTAVAGTDVYKVTCGMGTLSLLAAVKDNTQFIRAPTVNVQIIKHPHASIPAIDSVDDSKYSSLIRLAGGLGTYTVTVNKEQYIGTDLLSKGIEDYTALFSCRNKTSQTATAVKQIQ
jgi:mono/diheme cytochrome c family protein